VVQLAFVLFLLVTLRIRKTSQWKSQVIDDLAIKSWFSIAMLVYERVYIYILPHVSRLFFHLDASYSDFIFHRRCFLIWFLLVRCWIQKWIL
jgi:hypothetical protein